MDASVGDDEGEFRYQRVESEGTWKEADVVASWRPGPIRSHRGLPCHPSTSVFAGRCNTRHGNGSSSALLRICLRDGDNLSTTTTIPVRRGAASSADQVEPFDALCELLSVAKAGHWLVAAQVHVMKQWETPNLMAFSSVVLSVRMRTSVIVS